MERLSLSTRPRHPSVQLLFGPPTDEVRNNIGAPLAQASTSTAMGIHKRNLNRSLSHCPSTETPRGKVSIARLFIRLREMYFNKRATVLGALKASDAPLGLLMRLHNKSEKTNETRVEVKKVI